MSVRVFLLCLGTVTGSATDAPSSAKIPTGSPAPVGPLKSLMLREEAKNARRSADSQPIEFYGMIQDQNSKAPSDGYASQFEVKMTKNDPKWQAGFSRLMFLKSRGGQVFAKFNLMISIKADKAYVSFYRGLANPNGSRNLEISSNNVKQVFK
jgi:hypothetical protein